MTELLTSAQMRAIEAAAIASGAVTGLELMERAGAGVVAAVLAEWPEMALTPHRAVVLCGPGGNGGDGFVVARLLKARGWEVEVFLYGDAGRMPPDARANYQRWVGMGEVQPLSQCFSNRWVNHPLVIDSVFGLGLARPVPDELRNVLMATLNCRTIAVDIASFVGSDDGKVQMTWPDMSAGLGWAMLTVTFHARKVGHCIGAGAMHSGKVVVSDIGLADYAMPIRIKANPQVVNLASPAGDLTKMKAGHKYTHGHALVLSGPSGHGGAARLAARGALRIGAGVVTVGCPDDALAEHAARLDAVMLRGVEDAAGLAGMLEDRRINALCLGPGLGLDARAAGLVAVALGMVRAEHATYAPAMVLDADALTLLSRDAALFALLQDRCVLTPHAGEFARLFPDIAERLAAPAVKGPAYSKVDATREAAARAGCVVLFKGADTVIAAPDGRCSINAAHHDRAAPWLATAGSGDVLAGFICGLLARGFAPMQAAETAAWLHVECARAFGPGLIAEDLPEMLPQVFRGLGL